jgi:pyruvate/2-oxoglutarate/acetoin dehydrogenase E1 component
MEETQMGMSLGLAITGKTVISFYPRWDFLISAANQLINHVDKYELMTGKKVNILIRVGKGADVPLDPGHQHKANYIEQFKTMCPNIQVHDLKTWQDVELSYNYVIKEGGIHIMAEYPELYNK